MLKQKRNKGRIIFHIDMNSFYASVEMAYNPKLKGKPVAIAGNPEERRGIIVTSSYEARAMGVKTTMNIWQAKKLCPDLIVMKPNFERYRTASGEIFKILSEITPLVQPVSIDEGYMDVTDLDGNPIKLAKTIQQRILNELDLPSSIGIAPNKFLAKMASDMKKPLGITILRKRELNQTLWPLDVREMHGVGEKTAEKLNAIGVKTIGELANKDTYELKQHFGVNGERLKNRANGIDHRPVDPEAIYDFKSIGNSQTLAMDTTDESEILNLMTSLAHTVETRMKRKNVAGKTIQLMIRYQDRKTITRSKKLQNYVESKSDILFIAKELFEQHWNKEPIRLLGITVQDVEFIQNIGQQLDLFTYENEAGKEKLYETIEHLTKKYGENTFRSLERYGNADNQQPRTSFQKDFLDDYKRL